MSDPPAQKCNATWQALLNSKLGLDINDLCPACKKYGVELEVSFHRDAVASSASVPSARQLPTKQYPTQVHRHELMCKCVCVCVCDLLLLLLLLHEVCVTGL